MRSVPLTVVGGYLGAGKTSWINRLLGCAGVERLCVLVNDFGAIAVDAALIARHDGRTLTLANGCVCCAIGGDLTSAISSAVSSNPAPQHIVVEASGVADPLRIAHQARGLATVTVSAVLTLVNPFDVQLRAEDRFVGATVRRQLCSADLIAITHGDQPAVPEITTWLAGMAPGTPFAIDQPRSRLDSWIAGHLRNDRSLRAHDVSPPHADFRSLVWQPEAIVDRQGVQVVLEQARPALQRAKGWLRFAEGRHRLQLTPDALHINPEPSNIGRDALQCILVDTDQSDRQLDRNLRKRLDACRIG